MITLYVFFIKEVRITSPPALLCYPVMDLLHPLSLFIDILSVKRYKEIKATTSLTEIEFL